MRFDAINKLHFRDAVSVETPSNLISSYFASHVFNDKTMQTYLAPKVYKQFKAAVQAGEGLSRDLADHIAEGMRNWAIQQGATHYAHWFQPLTGRTAEKHDSFFTLDSEGNAVEMFSGNELVQQEPDGSSFPGGGLRSTFEARGYTAWDPSSPAFILEVNGGKTLCIPTIFVTYGGLSLDYKLPLLKSQSYLEAAAVKVCQLFDKEVERVYATLGWEQEYFVVDEALFNARPDLLACGRTLLGKYPPKGQQLDDHYFGSIPERVYTFMRDLELESHKLGIPVRTRHNEVAPTQFELAPIYEDVNVAVDHNQLLMDLMDRVARRHRLRVLLHEKPYKGVNGSGKHNNWSMATDTGKNLLSPGKNPGKNLQFLAFFVTTIRAVFEHDDLLRASIASASNDHRLGANEAPPAIISIFIGDALTKVLNEVEREIEPSSDGVKTLLNLLSQVPDLEKDNTDRNRTSPFAFTGNKFEIRMVGSTANCAAPMTVLNMMVGQQLNDFYTQVTALNNGGMAQDEAILTVIKRYIKESKDIRFEGDNYSDDWRNEAERRGLNNFLTTPDALDAYMLDSSKKLFLDSKVATETELHAHYEVKLESYALQRQIESRTLSEMINGNVLPAAIRYQTDVATNVSVLKDLELGEEHYAEQLDLLKSLSEGIQNVRRIDKAMQVCRQEASGMEAKAKAAYYCEKVLPMMENIREYADKLEHLIDDDYWNLPKYKELFYAR